MIKRRFRFLAPLFAASLVATVAACDSEDGGGGSSDEFPREETIYTGGAEWGGFANWNPVNATEATYLRGFIYEPLFRFDPWSAELQPWLAETGDWIEDDTYELTLREGILWHDGEAMTADDVKFTFDLREVEGAQIVDMANYLDEIEVIDDLTVQFHFSDPRRGQFDLDLFNNQIIPEHIWSLVDREAIPEEAGDDIDGNPPTGSGAYKYHSHEPGDRARFERNDDWWAIEHLGLEMAARYVIDFANDSNETAFSQLETDEIDMANFGLIGIQESPGYEAEKLHTFYDEEPFMLPANTSALIPNHDREPTNDPELLRGLAHAIDVDDIIATAYQGIVQEADNTALHPLWVEQEMVDQNVVDELGFGYDPTEAESILDAAGYVDVDDDGMRELPDGEPMELQFIVQQGWTDWEDAAQVIADGAQAVGINVQIESIDPGEIDELRPAGEFDLLLDNQMLIRNHPFAHYYYYYQHPVEDVQVNRNNPQRYSNEEAFALTEELAALAVPPTDDSEADARFFEILTELQRIGLEDMVIIPLWYNGLWSVVNDTYWTNWPSGDADTPNHYPTSWANEFNLGGYLMFTELEPTG